MCPITFLFLHIFMHVYIESWNKAIDGCLCYFGFILFSTAHISDQERLSWTAVAFINKRFQTRVVCSLSKVS